MIIEADLEHECCKVKNAGLCCLNSQQQIEICERHNLYCIYVIGEFVDMEDE